MLVAGLIVVFAVPWRRPVLSVLCIVAVALVVVAINMGFWYPRAIGRAAGRDAAHAARAADVEPGRAASCANRARSAACPTCSASTSRANVSRRCARPASASRWKGESRELTVLFSDVRNFTSVSERLPPRELSALMNAYLTPMTAVIHDHHGTIDKYIGDAIMAFWGAPLPNPRHPRDAVAAALGMQKAMRELGKGLREARLAAARHRHRRQHRPHERRRHGLGVSQGVHGAGRRGEPGGPARRPDQGVRRGHPVRRGDDARRHRTSAGAKSTGCASRAATRLSRSSSRCPPTPHPRRRRNWRDGMRRWRSTARGVRRRAARMLRCTGRRASGSRTCMRSFASAARVTRSRRRRRIGTARRRS